MNRFICVVLFTTLALATHAFGAVVVANLLVGLSLTTFLLLFIAGWVARQYISLPARRY